MPVATVAFDLSNPDDASAYRYAQDGANLHRVVEDLDQWLRATEKYHDGKDENGVAVDGAVCRERLHELLGEYGVKLYD